MVKALGTLPQFSNNLYDVFGVKRYEQGSAQTPWRWKSDRLGDEGLLASMGWRDWCRVILPGRLCVGPGCRGNPKCPPRRPFPPPAAKPVPVPRPPCNYPEGCISNPPYQCPPGTAYFAGWCIGTPEGCAVAFSPVGGGEPNREFCLACCRVVGRDLNWSDRQVQACRIACSYYGLPQ